MISAIALLLLAPEIVTGRGNWAALRQGPTCEAASQALSLSDRRRPLARASLSFDAGGPRRGQFAIRLGRVPRPGASVILTIGDTPFLLMGRGDMAWSRGPAQEAAIIDAMRRSGSMRVVARGLGGGRSVERFTLDGAPLAIDAAAACAARLANR